ncbi:hypothetical protein CY34DRAFT_528309 [Suillus luteus UH-Slu-Lm8-n1]|uniref:Uncharacterized protein n=1 Tax=Suillus luteus UH-Slu-Lm8-n1 TaxID=930992 RepID=A0A0D0AWR9_9AGAM|nr:hypothetical protein CY34DRAFT_528309 [Suillus luteus UH-Slu-Lm8-n1]
MQLRPRTNPLTSQSVHNAFLHPSCMSRVPDGSARGTAGRVDLDEGAHAKSTLFSKVRSV